MLNEPQYLIPYAVSCVFRDPATGNIQSRLDLIFAYNEGHAVGVAVNTYHTEGGTLPLFTTQSAPVSEEMARNTVAAYDEIAKLREAASNKITRLSAVPPAPPPEEAASELSPSEQMRALWRQPPKPDGEA
jgi:hypothetical protein